LIPAGSGFAHHAERRRRREDDLKPDKPEFTADDAAQALSEALNLPREG